MGNAPLYSYVNLVSKKSSRTEVFMMQMVEWFYDFQSAL